MDCNNHSTGELYLVIVHIKSGYNPSACWSQKFLIVAIAFKNFTVRHWDSFSFQIGRDIFHTHFVHNDDAVP